MAILSNTNLSTSRKILPTQDQENLKKGIELFQTKLLEETPLTKNPNFQEEMQKIHKIYKQLIQEYIGVLQSQLRNLQLADELPQSFQRNISDNSENDPNPSFKIRFSLLLQIEANFLSILIEDSQKNAIYYEKEILPLERRILELQKLENPPLFQKK